MIIKVSDFVKRVPQVAREQLPRELRGFHVFLMPWLSQVYYDDKRFHYEIVKLMPRYGENRIELGLHFESKDRAVNVSLLTGFDHYLFEVYAEPWDKGWTKIYTAFDYQVMDEDFLELTAKRLADTICVMQPIYQLVSRGKR